MMKTPLIYLLLCAICMSNVYGQQTNWVNLVYNGNEANHIAPDGDYIYVSTKKGYSVINRLTDQIESYDVSNSGLLKSGVSEILPGNNGKHYFNNNTLLTIKEGNNWDIYPAYSYFDLYYNPRNMRFDPNGELWMFGRGFIHYKGVFSQFYTTATSPNYFNSLPYTQFEVSPNGDFWFISNYYSLVHYDRDTFYLYNEYNSTLPTTHLFDLFIDEENYPWFATSNYGIIRWKDSIWEYYNDTTIGLPHNAVQEIEYHDGDIYGLLWGYPERQIFTYSEEGVLTVYDSTNTNLPLGEYSLFVVDDDGNMWFQVENDQGFSIVQFDGTTVKTYSLDLDPLVNEDVQYLSTAIDGGVDIINNENWSDLTFFNYSNGVFDMNNTSQIGYQKVIDHTSGKLFYKEGEVIRFVNGNYQFFDSINSGLTGAVIKDAQRDSQGNIWFSCEDGFVKFDGNTFNLEYAFDSGVLQNVTGYQFAIDDQDNFWFANRASGLFELIKFNGSSIEVFDANRPEFTVGSFYRVKASNNGEIYVYGDDKKLFKYDGVSFIEINALQGYLYSLKDFEVFNDQVYVSESNTGMYHYDGVDVHHYHERNSPMFSNNIRAITVDGNGNLWMAFNGGISIFSNNQIVLDTDEHTEFNAEKLTNIYPNPFDASFTLALTHELEEGQIQITDIQGRVVHTQNIKELENSVSLPSLNVGVYYYTVLQHGRILDQGKIIKR